MSKKTPEAPKKDSYGCIIGVEVYDVNKRKCVPITKPATVGTKSLHETLAWKSYKERKK